MNILCLTPVDHVDGVIDELKSFANLIYEPSLTDPSEIRSTILSNNIDVLYINPNKQRYILGANVLDQTPVKTIVTVSRGTNHIDMQYCKENNIHVIDLNKDPVTAKNSATAEHALGLTLALIRNIPRSFDDVKSGKWDYFPFIGHQLKDLQIGIIGLGTLGSMYAEYCRGMGAKTQSFSRAFFEKGFSYIMSSSDVISLHIPLTDMNYHLIDDKAIDMIKTGGAFLINTSRGEVVDEEAIIRGLKSGKIKGYATDVLENEKDGIANNPIIKAAKEGLNVIVTPHVAGSCFESAQVAHFRAIELLKEHYDREKT